MNSPTLRHRRVLPLNIPLYAGLDDDDEDEGGDTFLTSSASKTGLGDKILEEDEVITRRFFSDKGVLSMKHIMPDLEAKVYINGKLLTTFKVGEIEYLGW